MSATEDREANSTFDVPWRDVIEVALTRLGEHSATVINAVGQLSVLAPHARAGSNADKPQPTIVVMNALLFRDTRSKMYLACCEGTFQAMDLARSALQDQLGAHLPETALRICAEMAKWSGQGLDLIRPPHLHESSVYVASEQDVSRWRIDGEDIQQSLRDILAGAAQFVNGAGEHWINATELAKLFNVDRDCLRQRLKRVQRRNDGAFREIANAAGRQPRYEYRYSIAAPIAKRLAEKRPTKRPA